jgi:glycosyltransferase involved in cell wall biosynthesis
MKPKIIILSQTFPLTDKDPTAHFMLDFAQGFSQLGYPTQVLIPFHPNLKANSFPQIKVTPFKYIWPSSFHFLGFGNSLKNDQDLKLFNIMLAPFYTLSAFIHLLRMLQKEKPLFVNAHWLLPNGLIAALVCQFTKTPLIITLPGSDVYLAKKNPLFRWLAKFALSKPQLTVSNSPQLLKDLDTKGPVISYPVALNPQKRLAHPRLVIATAGRRVEKKGIDQLLKVYPKIEVISGLPIDQFRKKLLAVDIFIAYSIRDSKGNLDDASLTVLEAMAAGCGVITTDLPGNKLVINHNHNGLLVKDLNDLKRSIKKLKDNKKLRQSLGQNARQTIKKSFLPKEIAQSYLTAFEQVTT